MCSSVPHCPPTVFLYACHLLESSHRRGFKAVGHLDLRHWRRRNFVLSVFFLFFLCLFCSNSLMFSLLDAVFMPSCTGLSQLSSTEQTWGWSTPLLRTPHRGRFGVRLWPVSAMWSQVVFWRSNTLSCSKHSVNTYQQLSMWPTRDWHNDSIPFRVTCFYKAWDRNWRDEKSMPDWFVLEVSASHDHLQLSLLVMVKVALLITK